MQRTITDRELLLVAILLCCPSVICYLLNVDLEVFFRQIEMSLAILLLIAIGGRHLIEVLRG